MNRNEPLVSVIVPVKNGAAFIEESIESVEASLQHIAHEVIVIDDGSTDETRRILHQRRHRLHAIYQQSSGPSSARNAGIARARGSYIAFIDADDTWTPDHFTELYETLLANPKSQIAMGYSQRYESTEQEITQNIPLHLHHKHGGPVFMPTFGCALFASNVFRNVGAINPDYRLHEDVDWYLHALERNIGIAVTRRVVYHYRMHEHNTSKHARLDTRGLLHVLALSLQRRGNKKLPKLSNGTL